MNNSLYIEQSLWYDIAIGNIYPVLAKFLRTKKYSQLFVLLDVNVKTHWIEMLRKELPIPFQEIIIPAGEECKNLQTLQTIVTKLLEYNADRNILLINFGGGVVCDMGGFAASIYKRGIDFIHIPTTLLSQVDASVGGKTGIDFDGVKNILGTFTQPKAVFINPEFLTTLSEREIYSGFAEIIKHGLILDKELYEELKQIKPSNTNASIIHRSIQIKNEIVKQDPYEQKGIRKALNFGHTIGHAIETCSFATTSPLLHGEAVVIGMICEAYLSVKKGLLIEAELQDITSYLFSLYSKIDIRKFSEEEIMKIMKNDKKNIQNNISFTLLSRIGNYTSDVFCDEKEIADSLSYYQKITV